jgi:hypothetical protein
MTDRELDVKCAELMGWPQIKVEDALILSAPSYPALIEGYAAQNAVTFRVYMTQEEYEDRREKPTAWWRPSTDLNQAALVEEKAIEKVGDEMYGNTLALITGAAVYSRVCKMLTLTSRASARQRCIASLLAVEESHE